MRDVGSARKPGRAPGHARSLKNAERETALAGWEVIGHQRVRAGYASAFADTHANASHKQMHEILGRARKRGDRAPYRNRDGKDGNAGLAIDQSCDRQSERGVEYREGKARQQSNSGIADVQFGFDRFDQDRKDAS